MAIEPGTAAPAFDLASDEGENVSLASLKGRNVVLYFYPKDDTSGCTNEAKAFTEARAAFDKANTVVVGVSKDSVKSHARFRAKYALDVRLGADEAGKTIEDYGVWVQKKLYGREYMGIERATFLIDSEGVVRQVWHKVKVPGHVDAVLAAAQAL